MKLFFHEIHPLNYLILNVQCGKYYMFIVVDYVRYYFLKQYALGKQHIECALQKIWRVQSEIAW